MSFDEFLEYVVAFLNDCPGEMRIGQFAFSQLFQSHRDIAEEISGTDDDPFYDDTRLMRFLQRVGKEVVRQ